MSFKLVNGAGRTVTLAFRDACQVHLAVRNARGDGVYEADSIPRDSLPVLCGGPSTLTLAAGEIREVYGLYFSGTRLGAPSTVLPLGAYTVSAWLNLSADLPYRVSSAPLVLQLVE